jgi:hypothetical protein
LVLACGLSVPCTSSTSVLPGAVSDSVVGEDSGPLGYETVLLGEWFLSVGRLCCFVFKGNQLVKMIV